VVIVSLKEFIEVGEKLLKEKQRDYDSAPQRSSMTKVTIDV
jgi:hypothetical protein